MSEDDVYEMLWDCEYCRTPKLLGLTHRHCPVCGAAQNADRRYFPPDHEKVPVRNHPYFGADVACPTCREHNSRSSRCCRGCGGSLEGAAEVARRDDEVHPVGAHPGAPFAGAAQLPAPGAEPPGAKSSGGKRIAFAILGCLGVTVFGVVALAVVMALWKKDASMVVTRHAWERSIEIQAFAKVEESDWCDEVPSGARVLSRSKAERSKEKVKVGEDCKTRKKDLGNGTFKEVRECQPKYDEKPVLADKCRFEVEKWKKARVEVAKGTSPKDTIAWPPVSLARTGTCLGCEREGERSESYEVFFAEAAGSKSESKCTFDEAKWRSFAPGSKWKARVSVVGDVLDCSALQAP